MRRKEERSKQGQTNNKAEQHSTPKAVTFPKKNELPQVGLEPTTLYTHMYMGVLCCFALFVCLTLLGSFFLPSHLSFKNMYTIIIIISLSYRPSLLYSIIEVIENAQS